PRALDLAAFEQHARFARFQEVTGARYTAGRAEEGEFHRLDLVAPDRVKVPHSAGSTKPAGSGTARYVSRDRAVPSTSTAISARGAASLPYSKARVLEALPSMARFMTPCRMAASR